jgi:hypothetical protein
MKHDIPVGTSEPQDFQLRANGAAINGTGLTIGIEVYSGGVLLVTQPTIAWLNQASGTVRVTGIEALTLGSYEVRFKLTDGAGKIAYCPNGLKADDWQVVAISA